MCNKEELFNITGYIVITCSILSILSSLSIILMFIFYKEIRGISFQIIVCISISDLFRSIFLLFPSDWYQIKVLCQVSALIIESTIITNAIWSLYIIFILKQFYSYLPDNPKLYFKTCLLCAFTFPLGFQLLPLITDSYGPNEGICVYKTDTFGYLWRSVQFSILVIVAATSLIMYFYIFRRYRKLGIFTWKEIVIEKGMIYSIIFIFNLILASVFRVSELYLDYCENYALFLSNYFVLSIHGFLNFLAMVLNQNFRTYLVKFYSSKKIVEVNSYDYVDLLENKE